MAAADTEEVRKIFEQRIREADDPVTRQVWIDAFKKKNLPFEWDEDKQQLVNTGDQCALWLDRYITCDPYTLKLKENVRKIARVSDDVLIMGETGTGKEILARALHGERNGRFAGINCAGMPEQLVESELFGHLKGAFTGADKNKEGLMTYCADGTLFLDEIGDMPVLMQSKLLRVLQEKTVRKIGSNIDEKISCRIVAATNQNIPGMCDQKLFRLDLYARLSRFTLLTKPLRDRPADVRLILERGIKDGDKFVKAMDAKHTVDWSTQSVLTSSGLNVRGLESMVRRFVVLEELL